MAWKLTQDERKAHEALMQRLDKATHVITDKSEPPTAEEITAYNSVVEDITEHCGVIASRLQDEFSDKSERWQESETGESVGEFIETWECHSTDEIAEDDELDHDGAREELTSALDDFNDLPTEADL